MGILLANVAALLSLVISSQAQFETRSVSEASSALTAVVGDFNRDGTPDLAVINGLPTTGGVGILLGNGDGTFRAGANYIFGIFPLYGATASLRKNGILDLVFNDKLNDEVWVMLGNGDGTFQPAIGYPTTAESYMVALGDFTGDGIPDIAAIEGVSTGTDVCDCIEILPGNGDGTFGPPITTPEPYGLTAYALAVGDFNNDGKPDVALAGNTNHLGFVTAILLGDGHGSFTADGSYSVSTVAAWVTTGYFTPNKTRLDLAVDNEEGGSFSVLLGDGKGDFSQPRDYTSSYPSSSVALDLNGDGNTDLAVVDLNSNFEPGVSVYNGKGNGTFEAPAFYPADAGFVAAGDFNGDGKPDLVTVGGNPSFITTLLNTGVVRFSPTTPLNFSQQAVGTTSAPQTVMLTNSGATELKIQSMKASAEFSVTSNCGQHVPAKASCSLTATFSPTQKGAKTGAITIVDNASSKPQVIELTGTGT